MDIREALAVANEFQIFLKTGDESKIDRYTKVYLKSAVASLMSADRHKPWYQEILNRISFLERIEDEKRRDKWWQRPLFVGLASAVVTGLIAILGGYFIGVQKTINNIPIQSNNRQYGNVYAQQIIYNENGTFNIVGTALDQATGSTVKFKAISSDVSLS